jgi:FMN-dependent NADH-azoreductase
MQPGSRVEGGTLANVQARSLLHYVHSESSRTGLKVLHIASNGGLIYQYLRKYNIKAIYIRQMSYYFKTDMLSRV